MSGRESYQTECECIWIRILESGFRNFYADPRFASDPYHTVRIPSSSSDWARTSHVVKGTRHLDHPWGAGMLCPAAGPMPSRSGKPQILLAYHVYHYHLAVGGLGFISGWLDAEDEIFMQISLSFRTPIKIWNDSEKQTDNRRKIYSELLAHSEQIHSARRYLSTHFFCWFDKIYVMIIVNLTEILS